VGGNHEEERSLREHPFLFLFSSVFLMLVQFSMSEYVKDSTTDSGWKVVTYPTADEAGADTLNLTADAMDEGGAEGGSDIEPDES
jgi:hypothetical protein